MEFYWKELPMLRLLLPFVIGILLYSITEELQVASFILLGICLLVYFINESYGNLVKKQRIGGFILMLALLAIGYVHSYLHKPLNHKNHYSHFSGIKYYSGIIEDIVTKEKFTRVVFNIDQIVDTADQKHRARGSIMTYIYDIPDSVVISPGMRLSCYGFPGKPPSASIPDAFDYRNYLAKKDIYDLMFLRGGSYQLIPSNQISLRARASLIRKSLIDIIEQTTGGGEAATVISAMVLGERSGISQDTREIFTNTGAVHVLAVSGLHVGIVFLFIQFVLGLIPVFQKRLRLVKLLLVLLGIWFYAFLTGLAPSVIRSGIMMSLFAIGLNIQRKSRSVNTLASSAFIMLLLIDPSLIYQIGFQFSYLAVLGIILFQRQIENLIYIPYKVPAFLWKLVSVSIAAQLSVSPLSIVYFNQFPLSFIISSAIVVLLANVILVTVLLGLILYAAFNSIGSLFILFAAKIVEVELNSLKWLNGFPSLLLDNLWIAPFVVATLYVLLLLIANFNSLPIKWFRWSLLSTLFLTFVGMIWHAGMNRQKNSLYICSDDKTPFLLWQRGNSAGFISLDSCNNDRIINNTMRWRSKNDIQTFHLPPNELDQTTSKKNEILTIDDCKVLFIQDNLYLNDSLTMDYVVLQNDAWIDVTEFEKLRQLSQVIMTSGNKWSYQSYWKNYCSKNGIPFHNLKSDGFLKLINN